MDHASPTDGGAGLGAACSTDLDCAGGLACDTSLPHGMCTRPCVVDQDCGGEPRWACWSGRCHVRCNVRAILNPCRTGYVCLLDEGRALCAPDCRDAGCRTASWVCDEGSGLCVDPSAGKAGDPCAADDERCNGLPNGTCFTLRPSRDGFCTLPCAPFTKPCPGELRDAECLLGSPLARYCAFVCDPEAPRCPHPEMKCVSLTGGVHVCLHP